MSVQSRKASAIAPAQQDLFLSEMWWIEKEKVEDEKCSGRAKRLARLKQRASRSYIHVTWYYPSGILPCQLSEHASRPASTELIGVLLRLALSKCLKRTSNNQGLRIESKYYRRKGNRGKASWDANKVRRHELAYDSRAQFI